MCSSKGSDHCLSKTLLTAGTMRHMDPTWDFLHGARLCGLETHLLVAVCGYRRVFLVAPRAVGSLPIVLQPALQFSAKALQQ